MRLLVHQQQCSHAVAGRPGSRLGVPVAVARHARRAVAVGAAQGSPSFDSQDELDNYLSAELGNLTDPKRMEKMKRHYDLLWRVTKATKAAKAKPAVETCACCQGSGEKECDWCHGTGFMTVGDKIFTANNNGKCPVCKGTGYCKCEFCRGTGKRAKWLGEDDPQQHRGQSCTHK